MDRAGGDRPLRARALQTEPVLNQRRARCRGEGIGEAFRRWRDQYGEADALKKIEQKWTRRLWAADRDTALFVGNQFKNPDGFLVLGVFWPRRSPTDAGPSGPAQGGLLPPR